MKGNRKIKAFYSIDPKLYEDFEKYIADNLLDKSKLIEFLIREYMKNNTKNG